MPAVLSIFVGMIVCGAIIYRIRTFNLDKFYLSLKVSLFVYASLVIGICITNYDVLTSLHSQWFSTNTPNTPDSSWWSEYFQWVKGAAVTAGTVVGGTAFIWKLKDINFFWLGGRIEAIVTGALSFIGAGIISFIVLIVGGFIWLHAPSVVQQSELMPVYIAVIFGVLAITNSVMGIVATALAVAFAITQFVNGQPIDLMSLLGLLELAQGQTMVISVVMLLILGIIGAVESLAKIIEI